MCGLKFEWIRVCTYLRDQNLFEIVITSFNLGIVKTIMHKVIYITKTCAICPHTSEMSQQLKQHRIAS